MIKYVSVLVPLMLVEDQVDVVLLSILRHKKWLGCWDCPSEPSRSGRTTMTTTLPCRLAS